MQIFSSIPDWGELDVSNISIWHLCWYVYELYLPTPIDFGKKECVREYTTQPVKYEPFCEKTSHFWVKKTHQVEEEIIWCIRRQKCTVWRNASLRKKLHIVMNKNDDNHVGWTIYLATHTITEHTKLLSNLTHMLTWLDALHNAKMVHL